MPGHHISCYLFISGFASSLILNSDQCSWHDVLRQFPPIQSPENNSTYVLEVLVLLLELGVDLHQSLLGLIQIVLDGLDLLLQRAGLLLTLS